MEKALKGRKLILCEIAAVAFLDDYIPRNEWRVEIDDELRAVSVNGDPSDAVTFDETLRTFVWTNALAEDYNIMSGALNFNRDFTACHGRVTTGDQLSYLVESVCDENTSVQRGRGNLVLLDSLDAASGSFVPVAAALDQLAEKPAFAEPPPSYLSLETNDISSLDEKHATAAELVATDSSAAAAAAPEGAFAGAEEAKEEPAPVSKVRLITYATEKREKSASGDEEWEPFSSLGFGSDFTETMHTIVYFGSEDITQYVVPGKDGNNFTKHSNKAGDPWPWGFDITFTGELEARHFSGTLFNPKGKQFEWRGQDPTLIEVNREGSNVRAQGSDGLFLDNLLHGITSMSRATEVDSKSGETKSIDLAQKEADKVFGRLIFASVDEEVSKMLFPGKFNLIPAEQKIQELGREFLKRAGMHTILANIKESTNVKPKTKNKIKQVRCERFIPMCLALEEPANKTNDPVKLYGLDREKDKDVVKQLQGEAQRVFRACYLHGYRTAVASIQPYLNNAGEWYDNLQKVLQSSIFLQDWQNKATGSEGFAKTLYDLHTKLDVLWEAAQEKDEFKAKLPKDVKKPEEVIVVLNSAGLVAALDVIEWDDTSRAHLKEFFGKLDEVEKDARTKALAENWRRQMIIDQQKPMSFQTMGEYIVQLMEELRGNKKWSAREAESQLALLDARQAREALGEYAPVWYKDIKWKDGFMSYFRSAVTVIALGGLVYLFSQQAATMDWDDRLALFGQIAEGLASVRGAMATIGKVGAGGAMKLGSFLNKWILTPLGAVCKAVGRWLYNSLPRVGKAIIQGIGRLLFDIGKAVAAVAGAVTTAAGKVGTWLANLPIAWGNVFNALAKFTSFAISAVCFWICLRDCISAWKDGRPIDIVTSTIAAALAGLEVLCLVISGLATFGGYTAVASICACIGTVLAAAGIVFAVVLIVLAFVFDEDPLDEMVEKYGKMYGIVD